MSSMRRGDRRNESDDNAMNHPRSRQSEPASPHADRQVLATVRAQRNEAQVERDNWQKVAQEKEQQAEQTHHLYLEEQQKYQTALTLYQEEQTQSRSYLMQFEEAQTQATSYLTLYQDTQTQAQSYLTLYETEKARGDELSITFKEVETQRDRYLTLYTESQDQLKVERRSKAGIKGWETRRKRENQQLKQEILEMTVLLRDSLDRKEEAVDNLYVLADRMDRIQQLVDSVDEDSTTNPIGVVQKLQRIWQMVKEILAE
ncbi:hypothetical protein GS601_20445 [Myxacorys almedinensis A]|uniref:Uncharacterized protein n=2 Tax=Myxacorys TaxID=2056239 RepID=A0A8J7Z7U6_9CYAN|nr:hypothetical protein [Myxacorys almedinensis A]